MRQYLLLTALFIALIFSGCKKSNVSGHSENQSEAYPMESLEVSDSFTWRTHKEVTFTLESEEPGIASVQSANKDGHTHYRVRLIPGQLETFTVAIPAYENEVKILFKDQQVEVEITDEGHFTHTFVTDKSAPASVPQPLARTGR